MGIDLWAVIAYLVVMIVISVVKSRRVKTQDDFMVAGRGVTAAFWSLPVLVGALLLVGGAAIIFSLAGKPPPEEKWKPFQPGGPVVAPPVEGGPGARH